jgi:hypothetical protein
MDLKDFAKYIRGKSIDKLLHRARKSSLKRILASEKELTISGRRSPSTKRATGTK